MQQLALHTAAKGCSAKSCCVDLGSAEGHNQNLLRSSTAFLSLYTLMHLIPAHHNVAQGEAQIFRVLQNENKKDPSMVRIQMGGV